MTAHAYAQERELRRRRIPTIRNVGNNVVEHVRFGRHGGVELRPDAGGPPALPGHWLDDTETVAVELAYECWVTSQRCGFAAVEVNDRVIVGAGRSRFVRAANVARQFDFAPDS